MRNIIIKLSTIVLLLWAAISLHAQTGFDFPEQEISEIVYSVSLARSFPIICDDTVSGRATFRFAGGDFDTAFDSFLLTNRLYVKKEESRWIVSRMRIVNRDDGLIDIDACDMFPEKIFEKLSSEGGVPVIYDAVPAVAVSVHLGAVDACSVAAVIMRKFGGYAVSLDNGTVLVEKIVAGSYGSAGVAGGNYAGMGNGTTIGNASRLDIWRDDSDEDLCVDVLSTGDSCVGTDNDLRVGGLYSAELSNADFPEIIEKIAELSGIEFCSLVKPGSSVMRSSFSGQPFEKALEIICAHADVGFRCVQGLYVFFSMPDAGKRFREEAKEWFVFSTTYISAEEACRLMRLRFPDTDFSEIGAGRFMCNTTSDKHEDMKEYLALCDVCEREHIVSLRYIRAEDFLASLPPGFSASSFKKTGNGNMLFYSGSDGNYERLCELMEFIDRPAELLSYDLLIVQAQKSVSSSWSTGFEASELSPGKNNKLQAGISPSFKFNIDVVAAFGYVFSAKLQAAVAENKAKIFADTTLHGVSGVPISFRNTNTYRYRDPYLDTETGRTTNSSVTREIVSGLVLDITGWISGDGMITTSVTASYSRQGVDTSSAGNPPPTSEKIVTTQVRGRSGEVIVLSGLVQNDESSSSTGTPLLSSIPIIGWLFKSQDDTEETNELTIYLIPRICETGPKQSAFGMGQGTGGFGCQEDSMRMMIKADIQEIVLRRRQKNEWKNE